MIPQDAELTKRPAEDSESSGRVTWVHINIDEAAEDLDYLITDEERLRIGNAEPTTGVRDTRGMESTSLVASPDTSRYPKHLRHVVGWLREEFGERVHEETIRRIAAEELSRLQRAKVRDFIATISWRRARNRLHDINVEEEIDSV